MKQLLCALFLLAGFTGVAMADTGPYLELNLGYSSTGTSSIDKTKTLIKQESQHFGYNLNGGVLFLGFGAEAGYTRYADINYHEGGNKAPADLYGLHLALKTEHGFGPLFIFGKLGYGQLHRGSFDVSNVKVDAKEASGLYFGFGAGFKFMPTLALVAQYQQNQGGGNLPTANITTVGVNWIL